MSIPSPPRLSCDSKKFFSASSRKNRSRNVVIEEVKTPKDLPGDAKESINPDSFFPYDESSSTRSNSPVVEEEKSLTKSSDSLEESTSETVNNVTSSSIASSSSSSSDVYSEDAEVDEPQTYSKKPIIVQQVISLQEKVLLDYKYLPLKTFILERDNGDKILYLIQFSSFYGDIFFVSYSERTIMGEEKIFLYEVSSDKTPFIVSDSMTERLRTDAKVLTLYESSVYYQGKIYSQRSSTVSSMLETHNPSTYPVIDEKFIEDPVDLAMRAHSESLVIDSMYRHELKSSYNSLLDDMRSLVRKMEDHHQIFKEIDTLSIEESDKYYDDFVKRYATENPVPPDQSIHRIRFLNEASNRYVQAHFIFWNRLKQRVSIAKEEFESTIANIYLQMAKDYPDIDGIPVDPSVDIVRSYPGNIFSKDL